MRGRLGRVRKSHQARRKRLLSRPCSIGSCSCLPPASTGTAAETRRGSALRERQAGPGGGTQSAKITEKVGGAATTGVNRERRPLGVSGQKQRNVANGASGSEWCWECPFQACRVVGFLSSVSVRGAVAYEGENSKERTPGDAYTTVTFLGTFCLRNAADPSR